MKNLKSLREVITFKGGGTPSKQVSDYWGGTIPWATVKDFTSTSLRSTQDSITTEGLRNSGANLIPKGHVIIPTRMALGKAAINAIDLAINQDLRALIPKVELDPKYLLFAMLSLKTEIIKKGSGATVKGITQEELYNLEIPLPPLEDQKRIAYLLSKVEGLIAQRKQHLQQLDDLLKSVFHDMFGDELIDDESEATLEDYITLQQGFAFKSSTFVDEGVPIIKIGTINKGYFDFETLSYLAEDETSAFDRYVIYPGDLLISMTGTVGKDDYGNTCFVPHSEDHPTFLLNQRVAKIICKDRKANPYFINFMLRSPQVKARLVKNNRGVRQANLSATDIYSVRVSIPPIESQNQFERLVKSTNALKASLCESLNLMEALFSSVSQLAFKGELELSKITVSEQQPEVKDVPEPNGQLPESSSEFSYELPDPASYPLDETARINERTLHAWLTAYSKHLGQQPISAVDFLKLVDQKLMDMSVERYAEWIPQSVDLSTYEHVRKWIFDELEANRLHQQYDDKTNRVRISAAKD